MKKSFFSLFAIVLLLIFTGCSGTRTQNMPADLPSEHAQLPAETQAPVLPVIVKETPEIFEYRIGTENVLQIDVYYGKGEQISQKVRVSSRGVISFPLVGDVNVLGLTVSEFQDRLTSLLAEDYLVNPQVTVFIEEYSTVSILGEVKRPGAYSLKGRLSVLELVALAEGFTKIASPNKVKVIRTNPDGTREEILVRVNDIINKDSVGQDNLVLRAGDLVVVPESLF